MDRKLTFAFYGRDVSAGRTMHGIAGQTDTLRSKSLAAAKTVGILAGGTAIAGLTAALRTGFNEVKDYQTGLSQLRAGLKSTHGQAGTTVKGMEALASRIEGYSGQTDDSIVKTEQLLLTFTNIRNEAGKTNDIFDQTTKIAADMAQRMGGDASGAAIQLGKALNDPVKGITSLTRVGVSFTDQQKEQIAALVESGHTMKAQKVILRELNTEFGGSARAFGKTLPGQIERTKRAYEGISQELATAVLPYALRFTKWVRKDAIPALKDFSGWVSDHKTELEWFAGIVAGLAVSFKAFKGVRSIQALVGRGPLGGGGVLGAASMARPTPVYVTNPGFGAGGGAGGYGRTGRGPGGILPGALAGFGIDQGLRQLPGPVGDAARHNAFNPVGQTVDRVRGLGDNLAILSGDKMGPAEAAARKLQKTSLDLADAIREDRDAADEYLKKGAQLNQLLGVTPSKLSAADSATKKFTTSLYGLSDGANKAGFSIGSDLGRGLIAGIEAQVPHAGYAGKILVQQTAKQMRLAADAHSPSRVTMALGKDLADGLVKGYWDQKVWDKLEVDTRHGLMKLSRTTQNALAYRSDMRSSLRGYASLTGIGERTDSFGNSMGTQSTRAYLRQKVERLREFRDLREKLANRGASDALLAAYDELGPDAVPEMRRDLHSGRKGIRQLDRLEHRANRLAGQIAGSATEGAYGDTLERLVERLPRRFAHELARELRHLDLDVNLREQDRRQGKKVRKHHG